MISFRTSARGNLRIALAQEFSATVEMAMEHDKYINYAMYRGCG